MEDFQNPVFSAPIEGTLQHPDQSASQTFSEENTTLDEPVKETIMRDLKAVCRKFTHILYPRKNSELLKDWDLWGPLLLCVMLALLLQGVQDEKTGSMGPQFTEVFVVIWVGAAVVSLNSSLLGGKISLFQSICVLGYCIFPLFLSMIVCWLTVHIIGHSTVSVVIRILTSLIGYAWSVYASIVFLGESQPPGRKALAVYPICLFYFILAWMVATYS